MTKKKNTHDWSIDKPQKVDFEEDLNYMIDCVNAKKLFEIGDWNWKLKIEFENWIWKLKVENWLTTFILDV